MNHALFMADLNSLIYAAEKDAITIATAVLVVVVGIFAFRLLRRSV